MVSQWLIFFLKENLRKNKIFPILALMSLGLSSQSWGEETAASVPEFNIVWQKDFPETIQVGDRLSFELSGLEKVEGVEILKLAVVGWNGKEAVPSYESGFYITPLEKDNWFELVPLTSELKELPLLLVITQEGKVIGRIRPLPITVKSAFKNAQDPKEKPKDFISPVSLSFPLNIIIVLASSVLLILFFIGLFFWLRRRKRKIGKVVDIADTRREDEKLIDRLRLLEEKDYIQKDQFKKLYLEATEILKAYISFKYAMKARDATTDEILTLLSQKNDHKMNESSYKELQEILQDLDRVKFARYIPTAEEALKLVPRIKGFIQTTRVKS